MVNTNKLNARKAVSQDGLVFDSKKELARWVELRALEDAGQIMNLRRQVRYTLVPKIGKNRPVEYVADFEYFKPGPDGGEKVVEDVKGYRGGAIYQVFRIKKKLMLWVHGIEVVEV